uniref:Ubiquitin-like domain-containing protein n=1 Tax=Sparus aurata TaxID=8175 RepID=A0A671UXE1_SPAAU
MNESESILRTVTSPAGLKPEQHLRPTLPPVHRAKRSTATHAPTTKPSADMGKIYQVVVHGVRGEKLMIDLCNTEEQMKSMTVRQLKDKIAEKLPGGAGNDSLRLIFTDKMLDGDSDLLSGYGIQHMSVIHVVMKVPGGLTA